MAEHNDFGKEAEAVAKGYLIKRGYEIIAQNFRFQKAEIDLIAKKDNIIVVIEVKARSTNHFMNPEEAVNKRKIKLIISATNHFLEKQNILLPVRFDIISILKKTDHSFKIHHIVDAFEAVDGN